MSRERERIFFARVDVARITPAPADEFHAPGFTTDENGRQHVACPQDCPKCAECPECHGEIVMLCDGCKGHGCEECAGLGALRCIACTIPPCDVCGEDHEGDECDPEAP
jgi:hypothetical protein